MKNNTLSLRYRLPQTIDTEKLGAQIAVLCPKLFVLFLQGPLGVGKTSFARGFIQKLGDFKHIKSPTYTLVETYYAISERCIFHFDLYRLQNPLELEEIGIRDYTLEPAIWLVEWPEQAMQSEGSSLLPAPDIILCFSFLSEGHSVTLTAHSQKGYSILTKLTGETIKM